MYNVNPDDILTHKEVTNSRQGVDYKSKISIVQVMGRYEVMGPNSRTDVLFNPVTKDIATDVIQTSLLSAKQLGQDQLQQFVKDRLQTNNEKVPKVPLRESLKKKQSYICFHVLHRKTNKVYS
jgi:hypothetical protein